MKVYFTILLFFLVSFVTAQESVSLVFRFGMANYSMKSQKLFQQDLNRISPVPFRTVHAFPSFNTFGGSFGFSISKRVSLGLWGEYTSTGGRLSYGDYSGFARIDQELKVSQIGPFAQVQLNKSKGWPIYATMHTSLASTNQKLTSILEVGTFKEYENYSLKSINVGLRPGIMLTRDLYPFTIQAGLGAEMQFHGDMKSNTNQQLVFQTSDGKNLISQWDGLRVTFGIGLKL